MIPIVSSAIAAGAFLLLTAALGLALARRHRERLQYRKELLLRSNVDFDGL